MTVGGVWDGIGVCAAFGMTAWVGRYVVLWIRLCCIGLSYARARRAAFRVVSMSVSVCARDTNIASNGDGGR